MRAILTFIRRMLSEQPLRFLAVVGTLVAASVFEGLGIAMIVPLLQMASGEAGAEGTIGRGTAAVLGAFGVPLTVGSALFAVGGFLIAQQGLILLQQKVANGSQFRFEASLREGLYKEMFRARWPFFIAHKTGDLTSALTVEPGRAGYVYQGVAFMLGSLFVVAVYTTLALLISWQMTVVVLVTGLAAFYLLRGRMRRAADIGLQITGSNAELQSIATEHISGAKLVKGCGGEDAAVRLFSRRTHQLAGQLYSAGMNQIVSKATFDLTSVLVVLFLMYLAIETLNMTVASLVVFLFVFYRLSPRLSALQQTTQIVRAYLPALEVVDGLCAEARSMREREGGQQVRGFEVSVALESVDFSHVAGYPTLRSVSLDIPRFQTVAVVGPSGSGKTTVIDLVMGLLVPNSGDVLVDGRSLGEIDLHAWREGIGYVAQDSSFFHATVRENIAWSRPDATDEEVRAASRLANADEFIAALPLGYDTVVGDRGVTLSGGQRQRLALARALLGDPHLLILDEATSALDAESEDRVREAVDRVAHRTTILIVTHRLSAVRSADTIYYLEDGDVVESGTWDALTSKKGRFDHMRELQALG